jgi:hypothetical protein
VVRRSPGCNGACTALRLPRAMVPAHSATSFPSPTSVRTSATTRSGSLIGETPALVVAVIAIATMAVRRRNTQDLASEENSSRRRLNETASRRHHPARRVHMRPLFSATSRTVCFPTGGTCASCSRRSRWRSCSSASPLREPVPSCLGGFAVCCYSSRWQPCARAMSSSRDTNRPFSFAPARPATSSRAVTSPRSRRRTR